MIFNLWSPNSEISATNTSIEALQTSVATISNQISDLKEDVDNMGGYQVFVVSNGTNMAKLLPDNYTELTIDNFYATPYASFSANNTYGYFEATGTNYMNGSFTRGTWSYNASTGIFNMGAPSVAGTLTSTGAGTYKASGSGSAPTKAICIYPYI